MSTTKPLSEVDIRRIRSLRGTASAQTVGAMFDCGSETIRRIWRRETYREVEDVRAEAADVAGSLGLLDELLKAQTEGGGDASILSDAG